MPLVTVKVLVKEKSEERALEDWAQDPGRAGAQHSRQRTNAKAWGPLDTARSRAAGVVPSLALTVDKCSLISLASAMTKPGNSLLPKQEVGEATPALPLEPDRCWVRQ